MNSHTDAAQYPRHALINRFEGSINAEALFRELAEAGKVRFAMNTHDVLFTEIPDPPTSLVVQMISVMDLEEGDEVAVMPSDTVATLLALVFSDEDRTKTVLSKEGQIHLLCTDGEDEYTVVIFWNDMRRAWEIQKFDGSHQKVNIREPGFFLGPSVGNGYSLAVVA